MQRQGEDFVSLLAARIGKPIINAGQNGDTTAIALKRLDRNVLSRDPRIVIILLGGNDALRRVPLADTFSNLEKIIDAVHEKGAAVILVGVRGGLFSSKYNDEFEDLATRKRVNLVTDILDGLFGHAELMYDSIHPNEAGNKIMADRIEPILRQLIDN